MERPARQRSWWKLFRSPDHDTLAPQLYAVLAVPTDNTTKTALVTPENLAASASGTAGAECKVKINADSTARACKQTGDMLYVVYHLWAQTFSRSRELQVDVLGDRNTRYLRQMPVIALKCLMTFYSS